VEALGAPEDGAHGLEGHPNDVVVRLLGGQRAPPGLRVKAQRLRALIRDVEAVSHQRCPQPPRRPELGHLLEEIGEDREKE